MHRREATAGRALLPAVTRCCRATAPPAAAAAAKAAIMLLSTAWVWSVQRSTASVNRAVWRCGRAIVMTAGAMSLAEGAAERVGGGVVCMTI